MASNPDKTAAPRRDDVSRTRRHLLKAAAYTAPLIATLPSGAARAQASAANCVIELQDNAVDDAPAEVVAGDVDDGYIRVDGTVQLCGLPGGRITDVYRFEIPGRSPSAVATDSDGNWVDTGTLTPFGDEQPVRLLVLYYPVPADGSLPVGASVTCDLKGNPPLDLNTWPTPTPQPPADPTDTNYCIAPLAEVSQGQPGNIGMTQSCWCSLNPNDCSP